ncbi:MAG: hypothetical protein QF675_12290 [SAR324 cluster bacterium]|nr:hypothetical protein [SAR324 cluster bacterium]
MLAAMRGAAQLPLDIIDYPDIIKRAADLCADVWIEVGKAQLELVPESDQGYMAGDHGLKTWAPEKVIWLQEDAMALLSPSIFEEFFLPLDRRIGREFSCLAFHLHGSGLWAVDQLVRVPEINVLELNLEAAACDETSIFEGWKKIQAYKPLVIWMLYDENFWSWIDRLLSELPPVGISIQPAARNAEEGRIAYAKFLEVASCSTR